MIVSAGGGNSASKIFPELQKVLEIVRGLDVVYEDNSSDEEEDEEDEDDEEDDDDSDGGMTQKEIAKFLGTSILEFDAVMMPSADKIAKASKGVRHVVKELSDREYARELKAGNSFGGGDESSDSDDDDDDDDDDGHTFGPDSLGGGEVPTVMMPTLSELNEIKNAESSGESSNAKAQKKNSVSD